MSKIVDLNKKIEKSVVGGYKKTEKIVVRAYKKVEDAFVNSFLKHDGETVEEAKERLQQDRYKKKNIG